MFVIGFVGTVMSGLKCFISFNMGLVKFGMYGMVFVANLVLFLFCFFVLRCLSGVEWTGISWDEEVVFESVDVEMVCVDVEMVWMEDAVLFGMA